MNPLNKCQMCPRDCKVDRYKGRGYCQATNKMKVALASVHAWEEPCISGKNGSGTIFFSYCNLQCVYCQNYQISHGYGKEISVKRFSEICLELQAKKVHNINLVTPTHYTYQIIKGIKKARENGLIIPIVYNTSSYENIETIKLLDKTVDIYLADLKYYSDEYAIKYSKAYNYFKIASQAIEEMVNQIKEIKLENGIMKRGVIVRVLLLPGLLEDAKKIVEYLYDKYQDRIFISIMNQYTPVRKTKFPELNSRVDESDYEELINYAYDLGIRKAFIQEDGAIDESFIPKFDKRGV